MELQNPLFIMTGAQEILLGWFDEVRIQAITVNSALWNASTIDFKSYLSQSPAKFVLDRIRKIWTFPINPFPRFQSFIVFLYGFDFRQVNNLFLWTHVPVVRNKLLFYLMAKALVVYMWVTVLQVDHPTDHAVHAFAQQFLFTWVQILVQCFEIHWEHDGPMMQRFLPLSMFIP